MKLKIIFLALVCLLTTTVLASALYASTSNTPSTSADCNGDICLSYMGNSIEVSRDTGSFAHIRFISATTDVTGDKNRVRWQYDSSDCDDRNDGNTDNLVCEDMRTQTITERNCIHTPDRCRTHTQTQRRAWSMDYQCRANAASAEVSYDAPQTPIVIQEYKRTFTKHSWEPGGAKEYTTIYRTVESVGYTNDGGTFDYPESVDVGVTYVSGNRIRHFSGSFAPNC